jgi:deoxyribonuclease-4
MRFGFHISIAGGWEKVRDRAEERHCETLQIFSRNPRGWESQPLDPDSVRRFVSDMNALRIDPIVIHMPYLPNPASPDKAKLAKSVESLKEELGRAAMLSAKFVVVHAGKAMGADVRSACKVLSASINESLDAVRNDVSLLVENTAGQGTEIGTSVEELADILSRVKQKRRVGICLDTAHAFAAGVDFRRKDVLEAFLEKFDALIGLEYLKLIHLNDSKAACASRVDRHWHVGKGEIGATGMKLLLKDARLEKLPAIMETPWTDGPADDLKNLRMAMRLWKN